MYYETMIKFHLKNKGLVNINIEILRMVCQTQFHKVDL